MRESLPYWINIILRTEIQPYSDYESYLLYHTPPEWSTKVLENTESLVNDHAHLERKAATNALELITRWPDHIQNRTWVGHLGQVLRDEVEHFQILAKLMNQRGYTLTRNHKNLYAGGLRNFIRLGKGIDELVDRLLAASFIEARSAERFFLLKEASFTCDPELAAIYRSLFDSESGHFKVFLALAKSIYPMDSLNVRIDEWRRYEANVMSEQIFSYSMHSGMKND